MSRVSSVEEIRERVEELEVALRDVLAVAVQEQTDPPSDALGAIEDRARQALDTGAE